MPKLTDAELQKLQQNLRVGKCPNCGFDGDKTLSPMDGAILSLKERGYFDMEGMHTVNIVMTICPNCDFVSFFRKGVVLK